MNDPFALASIAIAVVAGIMIDIAIRSAPWRTIRLVLYLLTTVAVIWGTGSYFIESSGEHFTNPELPAILDWLSHVIIGLILVLPVAAGTMTARIAVRWNAHRAVSSTATIVVLVLSSMLSVFLWLTTVIIFYQDGP